MAEIFYGRALFGTGRGLEACGVGALENATSYQDIFEFAPLREPSEIFEKGLLFYRPVSGAGSSVFLVGRIFSIKDKSGRSGFYGISVLCDANAHALKAAVKDIIRREWSEPTTKFRDYLMRGRRLGPIDMSVFSDGYKPLPSDSKPVLKRKHGDELSFFSWSEMFNLKEIDDALSLIADCASVPAFPQKTFVFSENNRSRLREWGQPEKNAIEFQLTEARKHQAAREAKAQFTNSLIPDPEDFDSRLRRVEAKIQNLTIRTTKITEFIKDLERVVIVIGSGVGLILLILILYSIHGFFFGSPTGSARIPPEALLEIIDSSAIMSSDVESTEDLSE